jgi:mRNA-degrading endonuclease RelE of RelBE toxin-antitoxin system
MSSTNKFIFLPRFKRNYKKLTEMSKERVNHALIQMEQNLSHPSLGVKKIKGTKNIWEARASISLRITFNLKGDTIILRTVGEHDVLKQP